MAATTAYEEFVRLVEAVTGRPGRRSGANVRLLCPAHDDHDPSLDVREGAGGIPLVQCRSHGCSYEDVCAAIGHEPGEFNGAGVDPETWTPRGPAIAVYEYVDTRGALVQRVSRTADKQFPQSWPDPSSRTGWRWRKPKGFTPVLYRLDEVAAAAATGLTVYVCEGEKDADAIRRRGAVATCNPGGAGKWQQALTEQLAGVRAAVIVADNDTAGLDHALRVRAALGEHVPDVTVVVPAVGNDAADHLDAGYGLDELVPYGQHVDPGSERPLRITLAEILDEPEPEVNELVADVIEAAAPGLVAGLPEVGKGWLMLELAWRVTCGGELLDTFQAKKTGPVLYWWEDTSTVQARKRVRRFSEANELPREAPIDFHLVERMPLDSALDAIERGVGRHGYVLAILDSLYNFAAGGFELKDEQVASMILRAKDVCDRTGCSIIFVDHMPWPTDSNKGRSRAYGSVFKNAASRYGLYLEAGDEDGKAWFSARGNNVAGCAKKLAVLDKELLRWKLLDVESESDAELRDSILEAIRGLPGIGATVLRKEVGVKNERVVAMVAELEEEGLIVVVEEGRTKRHYDASYTRAGDSAQEPENRGDELQWR